MEDGERSCSDSDDGSSASWVILDGDGGTIGEDGDGLGDEPEPSHTADQPGTDAREEQAMDSSGDSAKTVIEQTDVSAVASPPESAKMEEGSDIEVIGTEHAEDVYYEDDPMELSAEVAEEAGGASVPSDGAALPTETVLRQRRAARDAARDSAEDRDHSEDEEEVKKTERPAVEDHEGPEPDQEGPEPDQEGPEEADLSRGPTVQPVSLDSEKDRWADDTDLSSLTDQPVVDVSDAGRLRQYVHQRNNTVNHLLTVVLVLCFTCVLGLGVGHFLGWLHHHELTEEMVHTLDEKLDVLRDDLMTCMTTEDDQDLDNKWIRELLTENEALLNQLHQGEDEQRTSADSGPLCSPAGYAQLRDQVNQLRMENDELKAAIAKMRYGTTSQNGHVLRRHWDQINQLVTENGELARELRRTRYLQPPAGLTQQEDDPAQSAGQLAAESEYSDDSDSDSDSAAVSPEFLTPSTAFDSDSAESAYLSDDSAAPFTTFSPDSDSPDSAAESGSDDSLTHGWESESESAVASDGLLSALLGWHPAPGSIPLQDARRRLWSLWQEASDFSRAEPASKYVNLADRSLAKVEKTLLKSLQKVQQLGREMLQDDRAAGGARAERVTEKLARKVEKVVSKLDARWREIRSTWEGKVTAREAEHPLPTAAEVPVVPRAPNASDPSVAAYYARRSQHRQRARGEDGAADNWQMGRGRSRAEMRGAFHGASWLLERAQARQQLRQRRGEDAEPTTRAAHSAGSNTWRREQTGRRGESEVPPTGDADRRRQWQQWSAADSADSSSEEHRDRRQWQQWGSADSDDSSSEEDDDDDDDDYEEHAARLARHMAATAARFQQRVEKTVRRHASNLDRKARENHWKHFGGRNRHQFHHHQHQRVHKY